MKFTIEESNIESFNDTHNQFNKFTEGLNIIFGENEIGKSTLMNFIKNILTKSSDAKGYIKCDNTGEECTLRAEKKYKNENLLPDKLNAHNYKEGFVITLDDIVMASKQASQDLVDIVKDSSGKEIKDKEDSLRDEIDNFIKIKTNKASKKLNSYFDGIIAKDTEIKKIQQYESQYNDLCIELEKLQSEIGILKQKQTLAQILSEKAELTEKEKGISINKKLLDKKENFEKLRDKYAVLVEEIASQKEVEADLNKQKENYETTKKELDKIEYFSEDEIKDFNSDKDSIEHARKIVDDEKDFNKKCEELKSDIETLEKKIRENDTEKLSAEGDLNKIGITDFEEYSADKNKLESLKTVYSDLSDKARKDDTEKPDNGNNIAFTIILALIFVISLTHIKGDFAVFMTAITVVSAVGAAIGVINIVKANKNKNDNGYSEELDKLTKDSTTLCNKYGTPVNDTNFVSQLDTQIRIMSDKISKYERINDTVKLYEKNASNLKKEKEEKDQKLKAVMADLESNNRKKEDFSKEAGISIQNVANYSDIFEKIKELREILNKIEKNKENLSSVGQQTEDFAAELNNFIKDTDVADIDNVSKYDYDEFRPTIDKIKALLDAEIKNQALQNSNNDKMAELDEKISKYPKDMLDALDEVSAETLSDIDTELDEKTRDFGRKDKEKSELEKVSGLIDLKNKKNIEVNNTKEFLKNLMEKEVLYNVILAAKEKYNEIQPNLMSAKEYLSKITNGKYSEIDFENRTISGEKTGEKEWDKLSRGTKEQLYLALRLGFAHNFSKDKDGNSNNLPDMPLIIDDAFVNFDKDRTCAILKCLDKISANNQVLFFTCHTEAIKDLLNKEKIKYNEIDLGQ